MVTARIAMAAIRWRARFMGAEGSRVCEGVQQGLGMFYETSRGRVTLEIHYCCLVMVKMALRASLDRKLTADP